MRHAEKPTDPLDPHLSSIGSLRATRLVDFIIGTLGIPSALFATALSQHSNRSFETLEPLSCKTGIPIDSSFADQDYPALAQKILSDNPATMGLTVVCWHHGNIPPLAQALGAQAGGYPDPWDAGVFNLILQINYSHDGRTSLSQLTEPF